LLLLCFGSIFGLIGALLLLLLFVLHGVLLGGLAQVARVDQPLLQHLLLLLLIRLELLLLLHGVFGS